MSAPDFHSRPRVVIDNDKRRADRLSVDAILCEPPAAHGEWFSALYARVIAASTGPVVVAHGSMSPLARDRFERASWPVVAPDADIDKAAEAFWPALRTLMRLECAGVGTPAPALVIVPERITGARPWPLFSSAGDWLFRALRCIGHDELTVYIVPAYVNKKQRNDLRAVRDAVAKYDPTWIALGSSAAKACRNENVTAHEVWAPAYAKRAHHKIGPDGYASHMLQRGVPLGHYQKWESLPRVPASRADDFLDVWLVPRGVHVPQREGEGRTVLAQVEKTKREAAREAYVTGAVPTIKDAAEKVGCDYQKLLAISRADDWESEREAHEQQVRAKTRESIADQEAKAIVQSRRIASANLLLALNSIHERLSDKTLKPKPAEAESLARTFSMLSERGDPRADEELERLRAMPLTQQVLELQERLKAQFGDDVLERAAQAKNGGSDAADPKTAE